MQNQAINLQIDRILSSNIRDELLSHIPFQFLQSPCIQKSQKSIQLSSSVNHSFSREQFEDDLYEKAEQILQLKEKLQSELANINQIVQDNQKLTEANLYLSFELKTIKNQWNDFRNQVLRELKVQQNEIKSIQVKSEVALHQFQLKNINKSQKMSICFVDSIQDLSKNLSRSPKPQRLPFKIDSDVVIQTVFSQQILYQDQSCQTDITTEQIESISKQINSLKAQIQSLNEKNIVLKKQIQFFRSNDRNISQPKQTKLQQNKVNPQQIQCYSSVFLKSVFSQVENSNQFIRSVLFKSQNSLFQQLQESKYFGKIVFGKKNGNALEQYKNGFHYEGSFSRNDRHGIGKLFYKEKIIYAGQWREGKFQGKGVLFYHQNLNVQKIQGNFKNGKLEGNATINYKSGCKLRAIFKNNQILSEGMLVTSQNKINSLFSKNSELGAIQVQNDQSKLEENEKIHFKTLEGQLIQIF